MLYVGIMARKTMGQGARINRISYVLELAGSMLYIIAVIYVMSSFSGFINSSPLFILASQGFWLPLFYSAAIAGTILLFVASFINLMKSRSRMSNRYAMAISIVTGISWLGLSAGNLPLTILVIFGFVISLAGSAFGMVD